MINFADILELESRAPDGCLPYGADPNQFCEMWHGDAPPVVVLVHGGCWLSDYDVSHVRPLAARLNEVGYSVWCPEYRRIGNVGGGWPATFLDIGRAIDHIAALPGNRDRPLVCIGHSAGGQLALWASARATLPLAHPLYVRAAASISTVIGLAAITNLQTYAKTDSDCGRAVITLLGGDPANQTERYIAVSPAGLEIGSRTRFLHGTLDTIVPVSQLHSCPHANADNTTHLPGAGHFDLIHPDGAAVEHLIRILEDEAQ